LLHLLQIKASECCFSHRLFLKDEIYQWRQYSGQGDRVHDRYSCSCRFDDSCSSWSGRNQVQCCRLVLNMFPWHGTREVPISRSHPFLEHSNLSICTRLVWSWYLLPSLRHFLDNFGGRCAVILFVCLVEGIEVFRHWEVNCN